MPRYKMINSRFLFYSLEDPPIPRQFKNLSITTLISHNKFSIQLDRDLLDNSNGPIKYVGVLVKRNIPGKFPFIILRHVCSAVVISLMLI